MKMLLIFCLLVFFVSCEKEESTVVTPTPEATGVPVVTETPMPVNPLTKECSKDKVNGDYCGGGIVVAGQGYEKIVMVKMGEGNFDTAIEACKELVNGGFTGFDIPDELTFLKTDNSFLKDGYYWSSKKTCGGEKYMVYSSLYGGSTKDALSSENMKIVCFRKSKE